MCKRETVCECACVKESECVYVCVKERLCVTRACVKESECVYVCVKERDSLCKCVSVCGRKNENEFIKIERCRWC